MRQRHQWVAGQLSRDATPDRIKNAFTRLQVPLLVVVDYAETRTDVLPTLIKAAGEAAGTCPVRLLLLARSGGDWWKDVQNADAKVSQWTESARMTRLGPLEAESSGRRAAYREAMECFARCLDGLDSGGGAWQETGARVLDENLRGGRGSFQEERFGSVLGLHMQALADLLQAGRDPIPGLSADGVEEILIEHEKRYWQQMWEELDGGSTVAGLVQLVDGPTRHAAVVTATLAGAGDVTDALSVLSRLPGLRGHEALWALTSRWLRAVYPPPTGQYWGALVPDRLGEHLVGSYLRTTPDYLLTVVPGMSREQRLRMLTVIARANQHQDGLRDPLDAVMERNADLLIPPASRAVKMVQDPKILHEAISESRKYVRDPGTFRDTFWTFEQPSTGRIAYEKDFGARAIEEAHSPAEKAEFLARHADHLSTSGRHDQAIETARRAVDIRRRHLGQDEDSRWGLALALQTLGVVCGRAENPETLELSREALSEAMVVVDSLDTENSRHRVAFMRLQAGVRNSLGKALAQVGPLDEAKVHLRDAIGRYRRLCELSDSDESRRFLAGALADYGTALIGFIPANRRLLAARERSESREAFAEARAIFEDLAERFPDQYLPDLAHTLQNLVGTHSKVGPKIATAEQAVDVYRKLSSQNPAYREQLAWSLMHLALLHRYRWYGRKQAHEILHEAIDIYDRCPHLKPEFRHDYLKGLLELATHYRHARSEGDVFPLADKGVRHARLLCDEQPGSFHELLLVEFLEFKAWSGAGLVEHQEEAAAAAREAWEIFERFDPQHRVRRDLRKQVHQQIEHTEQMLARRQQVLALRQQLEEVTIRAGLGTVEEALKQVEKRSFPGQDTAAQAEALLAQNRFGEAEPLARQWLAEVESYIAARPQDYSLRLVAVSLLGSALQGQQRYPEASALYQNCLDGMPDTLCREPTSHYLQTVAHYVHCLRCEDRLMRALQLLETTIPLARGITHRRIANQSLYADLLEYQAKIYFDQADLDRGRLDAAAASALDAVEVRRLVTDRDLELRFQSVPTLVVAAYIQEERRHYDHAYTLAEQAQEAYSAATADQRRELGSEYSLEMLDDLLAQLRDGRS